MRVRLHDVTHRNREGEVTTLVQLRVPVPLLKRLDDYRATVPMHPSRQQTIRWILEQHIIEVLKEIKSA
jgi:hypothetical protein